MTEIATMVKELEDQMGCTIGDIPDNNSELKKMQRIIRESLKPDPQDVLELILRGLGVYVIADKLRADTSDVQQIINDNGWHSLLNYHNKSIGELQYVK